MNRVTFSLEIFGDKAASQQFSGRGDNKAYIEHLKKLLRRAINEELTECQKIAVCGFYYDGKSVTQMALEQGVNKSTVSRNLKRAKEKLALSLRYGLSPVFLERD